MKVIFTSETKEDFRKHNDYVRKQEKSDGHKYQSYELKGINKSFKKNLGENLEKIKEYDQVLGVCSHIETDNNNEYQERLFNIIKSIIDNHKLDYISKLEKLNILLTTNKSLELYRNFWRINKEGL